MHFLALLLGALLAAAGNSSERATFVVQSVSDASAPAAIGSGVVVARDATSLTIVTAAHVVLPGRSLRILDMSRRAYYDVISTRALPPYDLLLIQVRAQPEFSVSPPEFATADPGETVYLWGNSGDAFWTLQSGEIRNLSMNLPNEDGAPRMTITCAACSHGDSGSGVFDARGRLLGILTAGWHDRAGNVVFLEVQPISIIEAFVNQGKASGMNMMGRVVRL